MFILFTAELLQYKQNDFAVIKNLLCFLVNNQCCLDGYIAGSCYAPLSNTRR